MKYYILPNKNLEISQSLFCVSGIILKLLEKEKSLNLDELFLKYRTYASKKLKYNVDLKTFILSIDLLFIINLINIKENGEIICETN